MKSKIQILLALMFPIVCSLNESLIENFPSKANNRILVDLDKNSSLKKLIDEKIANSLPKNDGTDNLAKPNKIESKNPQNLIEEQEKGLRETIKEQSSLNSGEESQKQPESGNLLLNTGHSQNESHKIKTPSSKQNADNLENNLLTVNSEHSPLNSYQKRFTAFRIIIQLIFITTSLFIAFFAQRFPKTTYTIFAFYASYFLLLIALRKTNIIFPEAPHHQFALITCSTLIASFIAYVCFVEPNIRPFVIGWGTSTTLCFFVRQFTPPFVQRNEELGFLLIFLIILGIISFFAQRFLREAKITCSAFVGGLIFSLAVAPFFNSFWPFDGKGHYSRQTNLLFVVCTSIAMVVLFVGVLAQKHFEVALKKKRKLDLQLDEISNVHYL